MSVGGSGQARPVAGQTVVAAPAPKVPATSSPGFHAALAAAKTAGGGGERASGQIPVRSGGGQTTLPPDVLYQNGVSDTDINQDGLNDCYVLSPLGEIARSDPGFIRHMIHDNGDGTYTVTLHQKDPGFGNLWGLLGDDKTVKVRVSASDFSTDSVNSGAGQDTSGGTREIWPQVVEAAYAKLIGGGNLTKGYQDLASPRGGVPADAMFTLTGQSSRQTSPISPRQLQSNLQQGKLVTFDTPDKDNLPYGLVGHHSYMVVGLATGSDGKQYLELRNPWGDDEPQKVPVSAWNRVFDATDVGSA